MEELKDSRSSSTCDAKPEICSVPLSIDLNEIPSSSSLESPSLVFYACDGCEHSFHLDCAGMRGRQAIKLGEWICGDCVRNGGCKAINLVFKNPNKNLNNVFNNPNMNPGDLRFNGQSLQRKILQRLDYEEAF